MQIRVFCRVRPGPASAVVCLPDGLSVRLEGQTEGIKDSSFAFDKVFGGHSSQADVFAEVSDMVQSALDGYKVTYAVTMHQSMSASMQGLCIADQQKCSVLLFYLTSGMPFCKGHLTQSHSTSWQSIWY